MIAYRTVRIAQLQRELEGIVAHMAQTPAQRKRCRQITAEIAHLALALHREFPEE